MDTIVAKFGGSSLADAGQIRKAADILRANPARRFVVVSAPGKRNSGDTKVTDLLYRCYDEAAAGQDYSGTLGLIESRYREIVEELCPDFGLEAEMEILRRHLAEGPDRDYMASRGEYLNARVIAAYLGWSFVEPAEAVFFTAEGTLDGERTFAELGSRLKNLKNAVIPGFYGALPDGRVKTFSRGGSDVTGSIVARSAMAVLYENWTDVSGMLSADPRIVENPRVIDYITYTELRELSYMGASVLHEDAVFPVRQAGIPINVRNTNRPEDPGTLIVAAVGQDDNNRRVTGIAGKKGFSGILVEKSMMNARVGFGVKLLQILAECGVAFEHCPSGIDTMSVVVNTEQFAPVREQVLDRVRKELSPELVEAEDGLAMIAVVGRGMVYARGSAARIFKALADADINIRMIDQGSSEMNIIVGVAEADYENAVRAIYHEMEIMM